MKTKEEIYNDKIAYWFKGQIGSSDIKEDVLDAMEEYAAQFQTPEQQTPPVDIGSDELKKDAIENIETEMLSLAVNDYKPRMALLQAIDQIKRLAPQHPIEKKYVEDKIKNYTHDIHWIF